MKLFFFSSFLHYVTYIWWSVIAGLDPDLSPDADVCVQVCVNYPAEGVQLLQAAAWDAEGLHEATGEGGGDPKRTVTLHTLPTHHVWDEEGEEEEEEGKWLHKESVFWLEASRACRRKQQVFRHRRSQSLWIVGKSGLSFDRNSDIQLLWGFTLTLDRDTFIQMGVGPVWEAHAEGFVVQEKKKKSLDLETLQKSFMSLNND